MPTVSSLLRSASSARKKIQQQEDNLYSFQWENSAQTYEDFRQYSDFLSKRANQSTNPSDALTYNGKIRSARRSYTSNEIQRKSISVLQGNGTLQDKLQTVYDLAQQAADNGDDNLVQNLSMQYSQIDKQIQEEAIRRQENQQKLASQMSAQNIKSVNQLIKQQESDLKDLGRLYEQSGAEGFSNALKDKNVQKAILETNPQLKELFDKNGEIGFWDIANGVVQNIKQTYEQAAGSLPPDEAQDFIDKLDKINYGETKFKIPGVGSVTADDLQNQMDAVRAGGTYFYQGPNNTMEAGNLTNYTWAKDENGQYRMIKQYSQKGTETEFGARFGQDQRTGDSFNASLVFRRDDKGNYLNDKGKVVGRVGKNGELLDAKGNVVTDEATRNNILKSSTTDYKTLLENNGFKTAQGKDGTIRLIPTEQVKDRFKELGINEGAPVEAVVDPQGNLRFVKKKADGTDELFQIGFDEKGKTYIQQLKDGSEGAVSAQDYFEMRQAQKMFGSNTPFAGINAGRSSLASANEVIARGENFRYGKLRDMEERRKFLESQKADALKMSSAERISTAIMNPIVNNIKKVTNYQTPGQAAANRSLSASISAVQSAPKNYGVLKNPATEKAFVQSLQPSQAAWGNSAPQKVAQTVTNIAKKLKFW